jgi:aspartate 1-decarboxylase
MIRVMRAKLHGLRVTATELDYEGSIALDPEFCSVAGIYPLEFVEIWNKTNGARLSTYVILAEPGSRACMLNGAAARLAHAGDEVIIVASEYMDSAQIGDLRARVLTFRNNNEVDRVLTYSVTGGEEEGFGTDVSVSPPRG